MILSEHFPQESTCSNLARINKKLKDRNIGMQDTMGTLGPLSAFCYDCRCCTCPNPAIHKITQASGVGNSAAMRDSAECILNLK